MTDPVSDPNKEMEFQHVSHRRIFLDVEDKDLGSRHVSNNPNNNISSDAINYFPNNKL